ncbi:MAG TPA: hypothetical protein VIW69_07700 [Candidatus Elarobacter sp.]
MAKIHDNIESLFGGSITEEIIVEAFRVEHTEFTSHVMLSALGDGVFISGEFNAATTDCRHAGVFQRYLYRAGGTLVAHHVRLFVEQQFRRRGLAGSHFGKLIRFYDAVGIEYVHLDAVDDGPVVWPQMGFELNEPSDVKLLHKQFRIVMDSLGYEADPPRRAPALALYDEIEGIKVGLRSLALTYRALGERPIPMVLDLRNADTRAFLGYRGIL